MNIIMAAAAMNFKRVMNLWRTEANRRRLLIHELIVNAYVYLLSKSGGLKLTF